MPRDNKSDNGEGIAYLLLIALAIILLALPSGFLALSFYQIIYNTFHRGNREDSREKREKLAWISTALGIISYTIYFFYTDFNKIKFSSIMMLIIFGILSYYLLYKVVTFSNDRKN